MQTTHERMLELAHRFPTLAEYPGTNARPWISGGKSTMVFDATHFMNWMDKQLPPGSGQLAALNFMLYVWNPHADWSEFAKEVGLKNPDYYEKFDLYYAMNRWDGSHMAAWKSWASDPFFG